MGGGQKAAKTRKSIENLKAATENLKNGHGSTSASSSQLHQQQPDERSESAGFKSVISDGDTQEYIKNLLKGSGASINFDALREELGAADKGDSFAHTVSSVASIDHHQSTQAGKDSSISNLDSFNDFLKSQQQDPNISQIPQKAFFSSSQNSARSDGKQLLKEKDHAAFSVGSRNPLGSSNGQVLNVQDLEKSPLIKQEHLLNKNNEILSTMTNISTNNHYETSASQLERLSKRLASASFNPLHSSLLTCSETQAFYLYTTLEGLMNEYENRGTTIQNLINQLARSGSGKENMHPSSSSSGGDFLKSQLRIQDLERQIHELKQELDQKTYLTDKLQFEAKSRIMREESIRNRNYSMMEAIKQKYYFDNPGLEPIISTVIEAYEEKLASDRPVPMKQYKDEYSIENESMASPTKNVETELRLVKEELKATQQERDLLNLKLLNNETRPWQNQENQSESFAHDMSTRERIQRDKKVWREKHGHQKSILNTSTIDASDSKTMIKEVCHRLGITDFENILPAVEKIQLVFRLIPQMEQFIRDVNATITAYNISATKDTSMTSSVSPSPQKLSESLQIIRRWADNMSSSSEHQKFISDLHSTLKIKYSAGSLEQCALEIERLIQAGAVSPKSKGVDLDEAQKIVLHIMGLFSVPTHVEVIARMNELYVFWAEVNNGLTRLQDALRIEKSVQPGRVLVHAAEIIEKSTGSN